MRARLVRKPLLELPMSWDEAVAEANAASPPDAPLLKIRADAAELDPGLCDFRDRRRRLGSTMAFPLRTPSPFWSARGVGGQPRWFRWGGGCLFFRGSVAV